MNLKLIKVSDEPVSGIKAYLKKMRSKAAPAPTENEIMKIVDEVRVLHRQLLSQFPGRCPTLTFPFLTKASFYS